MKNKLCILIALISIITAFSSCTNSNYPWIKYEYSDSSKLIAVDNHSVFHWLFGNMGIMCSENYYLYSVPDSFDDDYKSIDYYNDECRLTEKGKYLKYAFSEAGYIAYYDYDIETFKGTYNLYSTQDGSFVKFSSSSELYKYADENSVSLGEWYYDFKQQDTIAKNGNWSVVTTADGITAIRNGVEDSFSGKINEYASSGNMLAFHIYIDESMAEELRAFGNPILKCSEEKAIGKTFFFRQPIYFDTYAVVDTSDDSYEFFDNKKAAEANFNEDIKWQKVKYE